MLKMAKEPSRVSFTVDLNLFLIIFNLLNDRSPEQFEPLLQDPRAVLCLHLGMFAEVKPLLKLATGVVHPCSLAKAKN